MNTATNTLENPRGQRYFTEKKRGMGQSQPTTTSTLCDRASAVPQRVPLRTAPLIPPPSLLWAIQPPGAGPSYDTPLCPVGFGFRPSRWTIDFMGQDSSEVRCAAASPEECGVDRLAAFFEGFLAVSPQSEAFSLFSGQIRCDYARNPSTRATLKGFDSGFVSAGWRCGALGQRSSTGCVRSFRPPIMADVFSTPRVRAQPSHRVSAPVPTDPL